MRHRITIPPASALWSTGGFTISLDHGSPIPHARYLVSVVGHERRFDKCPTDAETVAYVMEHVTALRAPGAYFGGWHDPESDVYYLDVTRAHANLAEATRIGIEADQRAIYDSETGETINLARDLVICFMGDGYVFGVADVEKSLACEGSRYWAPAGLGETFPDGFELVRAANVPPRTAKALLEGPGSDPPDGSRHADGYDTARIAAPFLDDEPFLIVEGENQP